MAFACLPSEPCSGTGSGPDDNFASVRMRSPFGGLRLIDARDADAVHMPGYRVSPPQMQPLTTSTAHAGRVALFGLRTVRPAGPAGLTREGA
jgi:hypothetical protein